jgi:MFS transporter, ACS family, allantoate permease
LTEEEKIAVLERVRDDQGGTANKVFKREQVYEAFTDVRTWFIVLTTLLSECYSTSRVLSGNLTNMKQRVFQTAH